MISREAEPIGHVSPRPPIELNARFQPEPAETKCWAETVIDAVAASQAKVEADRIWCLVVQSAEGRGCVPAHTTVEAIKELEAGGGEIIADYAPSDYVALGSDPA